MSEVYEPRSATTLTTPATRRRVAYDRVALVLAGVGVVGLLVLTGFLWRGGERIEATRQELSRRLADHDGVQKEMQATARQHREALDALQAKMGALDEQLAEMQGQQKALETMYQELSRVRDDRLLAEIEQTVSIAAQQLQLAGNVEAALIALSGAEARLARLAQPQFLNLRKLIARDIERLKALPGADITGIALKLDGIVDAISGLPLAFEQRPVAKPSPVSIPQAEQSVSAVPPAPTFTDMLKTGLGELWQELRQLIRIERLDRPDPGLLAPREAFFLREHLRLRLLSARLALLARDGRSFKGDLRQSAAWLEQYFDTRAPAVQEVLESLNALGKLKVVREAADLNETLAALRNVKSSREGGASR